MSFLPRLLGSASVVVALAAAASPAQAASTVTFPAGETPVTTVQITDPGPTSPTVHLVVTAPDPTALAATHVYLGANAYPIPYSAIGVDGVRDARYAEDADGELSTEDCLVYDGSDVVAGTPITVSGNSFSADLPKGDVIAFDSTAVAVGIVGEDASCTNQGFHGLAVDYLATNQEIDGFAWDAPAAPVVTATGGRRQVALSFDQERGTQYDIYRAGSDVPVAENIRGNGDDVQVVLSEDEEGQPLAPGTAYSFEVKATRLFYDRDDETSTGEPAQRTRHRHDGAGPGRHVHGRSGGEHDRPDRPVRLDDQRQRGRRGPVLPARHHRDVRHRGPVHGDGREPVGRRGRRAQADRLSGRRRDRLQPRVDGDRGARRCGRSLRPRGAGGARQPGQGRPRRRRHRQHLADQRQGGPRAGRAQGQQRRRRGEAEARQAGQAGQEGARVPRHRRREYKLVTTVSPKAKTFTDKKVKPGKTYRYKSVAVNAKGQQGAASKPATVKVKKAPKGTKKP